MKKVLNKSTANFDELEILPMFPNQSNRLLRKEMTTTLYEYHLFGEIGESTEYIELIDALRSAGENDEFVIRINSGGGLLSSANVIINAINQSQAHVHGVIESECASAATMVFLSCHSYSLAEEAEMMIHTSSSGYVGKEQEIYQYAIHTRKKIHRMMNNRYTGFLTDIELLRILDGIDLYFDRDDIAERLENFSNHHRELYMKEMEAFQNEVDEEQREEPIYKKNLPS